MTPREPTTELAALHETHVCRDCGAEITIPYARAAAHRPDVPGLREAFEAGWLARDKAKDHVGSERGFAAEPVGPTLVHDESCCASRGCHPVCSHLCGTDLAIHPDRSGPVPDRAT